MQNSWATGSGDAHQRQLTRSDGLRCSPGRWRPRLLTRVASIDDIDYLNAHATSTPLGDPVELVAPGDLRKTRPEELEHLQPRSRRPDTSSEPPAPSKPSSPFMAPARVRSTGHAEPDLARRRHAVRPGRPGARERRIRYAMSNLVRLRRHQCPVRSSARWANDR